MADLGSVDVDTLPSRYIVRFRGVICGADPRERIDYLLWADSKSGASQQGFVTARLGRGESYGSDHRFVYGDARIP